MIGINSAGNFVTAVFYEYMNNLANETTSKENISQINSYY